MDKEIGHDQIGGGFNHIIAGNVIAQDNSRNSISTLSPEGPKQKELLS